MMKVISFVLMIVLILTLVSCDKQKAKEDNGERYTSIVENNLDSETDEAQDEVIRVYHQYPENPSEQLRGALEKDANERGLPIKIGSVETVEFERKEYKQIRVDFTDGSENVCIISFFIKDLDNIWDEPLDERDNPSFTMAFKDPDNSQAMVVLLTSIIGRLSPDLSLEEAERLAERQDATISTDGYAQPSDISGYQVQAQYTNPHIFVSTPDFDAKLGVKVRALEQIWRGAMVDIENCQEMKTPGDYEHLTAQYNSWDDGRQPDMVYADFIVKNTWREQSYLHGETWTAVDIESMTGQRYVVILDTVAFPNAYEFGVGQKYTLYVGLNYASGVRGGIMYAVQRSESAQFNSRGEQHPLDYPAEDWYDHLWRVEPEGEGTIYDVYYVLQSQTWGETFAALEGHGVGEEQWPSDPVWEGYTFVGWYDNPELEGEPYTKDTPIYQDTSLYAKWKYSGSGGAWPRARRGVIQGIGEGDSLSSGQRLTITTSGYNMDIGSPREQRFRWKPVEWRLSDGTKGSFTGKTTFEAELLIGGEGDGMLYISYLEETFDGTSWQETGQICEVPEVSFQID